MKKYNCTLCMSGSRSLIFSIGNVLLGVKKHSPSLFDRVVVYTDKLPDNDIIALKKIFDFIEIVEYTPKFNSYLSAMYSDPTNQGARLPCPVYADFEIFNLIKKSKHVVYLDSDILIKKDISSLLNYGSLAMRKISTKLDDALGVSDPKLSKLDFYNSGIIVLNDKVNYSHLADECYKIAQEYAKTNAYCDQSVLVLACHRNSIKITNLPRIYNDNINCSDCSTNFIVHQNMKGKFWKHGVVNALFPEWNENNDKWIEYGGTPYDGEKQRWGYRNIFKTNMNYKLNILIDTYELLLTKFYEKLVEELMTRNVITEYERVKVSEWNLFLFKSKNMFIKLRLTSTIDFLNTTLVTSFPLTIEKIPSEFNNNNKIGFNFSIKDILILSKYDAYVTQLINLTTIVKELI